MVVVVSYKGGFCKTMVRQAVFLQLVEVNSATDTHLAACGAPHAVVGGCT